MKTSNPTCGWLAILAALALPLYAVDGVVLINQNSALAGNVTPGDAPGFPVTISLPGSYRLSGNLTVPDANTTAILVSADGVTIDLNGFSIVGPNICNPISCSASGNGVGINASFDHTTVLNGYVRGMGASGVLLLSSSQVERVKAISNGGAGIFVLNGDITSCVAEANGSEGLENLTGVITGNHARFNGGNGIKTIGGVVSNNTAWDNGANGILGGNGSAVFGNTVFQNHSAGISAACPSLVTGNAGTFNTGGDIFTSGSGCIRSNNLPAP